MLGHVGVNVCAGRGGGGGKRERVGVAGEWWGKRKLTRLVRAHLAEKPWRSKYAHKPPVRVEGAPGTVGQCAGALSKLAAICCMMALAAKGPGWASREGSE